MQKKFIIIALFFLGCNQPNKKPDISSFQNKWGVAFYIFPKQEEDGCKYRMSFLPLKNQADTVLIKENSTIFDFNYDTGMDFTTIDRSSLNIIYNASQPNYVHFAGNYNHVVFWAFVRLKYSVETKGNFSIESPRYDTLVSKKKNLPIKYYELWNHIKVDSIIGKKLYNSKIPKLAGPLNHPC